jgi:8-oxo-dGTP pyrophosphatase MutT (NUDIX family)
MGNKPRANVRRYSAAGGVVVDGDRVLVLYRPRREEFRLPKGHIEEGESALDAAAREVAEEGGVDDLEVLADLGDQHARFEYQHPREGLLLIDRDEHYFLFRLRSPREVERPAEAHKFEPRWVPIEEAASLLTYKVEREWLRRALSSL